MIPNLVCTSRTQEAKPPHKKRSQFSEAEGGSLRTAVLSCSQAQESGDKFPKLTGYLAGTFKALMGSVGVFGKTQ